MPPIIQTYDPLSEGLDAAASFVQGGNDARDKALALARAREQTEYDRSEDQKRDKATSDEFDERKSEFGATHALDVQSTEAGIAHTQHQDKISDAVEATRKAMAPLLARSQALQNQLTSGQIRGDQARTAGLLIANDTAKAQAALEAEFGRPMAQMALTQAQANIGSTMAGTQSTVASTARSNALLPYETAQASLNLTGTDLENKTRALQNRATFDSLQTTANTPLQKTLAADYKSALTSYTSRSNTYDRLVGQGKTPKGADGKPLPPPAEPTSPEDLEALIADAVDAVQSGQDTVAAQRAGIEKKLASGAFTPYQARYAEAQLARGTQGALRKQALRNTNVGGLMPGANTPGSSIGGQVFGGGPGAGNSPFSGIISSATSAYQNIPHLADVVRRVMHVESGGDPSAVSSAGAVGLMQLMPDTARGLGVTNARDPVQAIHGGTKYLAQLYQQFGSWPLAIAAYNAGPGNVAKYGMNALHVSGADPLYVQKVLGA